MAGLIRVAGHTIAEHDIVNDKVDIKNATLASSVTFPAGHIIKATFSSDLTTYKNNSTSSYVTTGLSLTVNKTVSSSYILIQVNANLQVDANAADINARFKIQDTTNSRVIGSQKNFRLATAYTSTSRVIVQPPIYFAVWDTNSGTGNRTYDLQFLLSSINDGTGPSSNMFALEIMQ